MTNFLDTSSEQKSPFFSVVMPTYNRGSLIENTLRCILSQTFQDFEIVIIDDGSTDNTGHIIQAIGDPRIRFITQNNSGPLMARANGCDAAKGCWIAFCDSDDKWDSNYLEHLRTAIRINDIQIIFTDYIVEGESAPRISGNNKNSIFRQDGSGSYIPIPPDTLYKQLMQYQPIMISAFAIETELYKKIGGIKRDLKIIGSEDAHLTQRACAVGRTAYIDEPLVLLGRGADNLSSNYIRNLEGGMRILEDFVRNGLIPPHLIAHTKQAISSHALEISKQYYWNRELGQSFIYLKKCNQWYLEPQCIGLLLKLAFRQIF